MSEPREWVDLRSSGLLWLINRQVFHPRGYHLALTRDAGTNEIAGWTLMGDGTELGAWHHEVDEADGFAAAQATLASKPAA